MNIQLCDYCGQRIEDDDLSVQISAVGTAFDPDRMTERHEYCYLGHYHSTPAGGERSCYGRMLDAIFLMHETGPSLETIETASSQWVAAQRRKFRKG